MKKILITGGTGFIGSNLIKYIDANHHDYICYHIDSSVDITDRFEVKDMLEDYQPDVIIHLAAISNPKYQDTELMWKTNVDGTRYLLNCCGEGVRFIFASSINVYGNGQNGIYTTVSPNDTYSASKVAGEALVLASRSRGIRGSSLRLCGVVGPNLTHGAIRAMIGELQISGNLTIYGWPDGAKKPFLHVEDVCRAFCESIKRDKFDVLNINNRDTVSTREIADLVLDAYYGDTLSKTEKEAKKIFTNITPINQYGYDGKLTELILEWSPSVSSIEAIARAIGENL